jgi:hypothetical protein
MSDLIEKVREAVRPHLYSEGGNSEVVARAAIKAVAEWAEKQGHEGEADYLITLLRLQLKEGSE